MFRRGGGGGVESISGNKPFIALICVLKCVQGLYKFIRCVAIYGFQSIAPTHHYKTGKLQRSERFSIRQQTQWTRLREPLLNVARRGKVIRLTCDLLWLTSKFRT